MIIKRNFNPLKVWQYIKKPMLFVICWSTVVWILHKFSKFDFLYINFTPIGVLGSALAIFIAFRNNSAYGRWWEARQIWSGVVNSSRVLARLIITFTDSHSHKENYNKSRSENFKNSMVKRCIAWAHSLRIHLRNQKDWDQLRKFLNEEDFIEFSKARNKPNYLQLLIGKEIYKAMGNGTLGGFDSFQMEGQLLALGNYFGSAEKIKNTPLPRQYDFFTRVFVILFSILLPFGMLGFVQAENLVDFSWFVIPLSILVSGVFIIMERTGDANEDPFENRVTDIPMTALCNTIERDLLEMLGEEIPTKVEAKNGYLF